MEIVHGNGRDVGTLRVVRNGHRGREHGRETPSAGASFVSAHFLALLVVAVPRAQLAARESAQASKRRSNCRDPSPITVQCHCHNTIISNAAPAINQAEPAAARNQADEVKFRCVSRNSHVRRTRANTEKITSESESQKLE